MTGGLYAWELEKDGREVRVRVEGQLAFNSVAMIVRAAEAGLGLALVMEDLVAPQVADGRLVRILEDWCPPFTGFQHGCPRRAEGAVPNDGWSTPAKVAILQATAREGSQIGSDLT